MSNCYFCEQNIADAIFIQKMHKKVGSKTDVQGSGQIRIHTTTYETQKIEIPICRDCLKAKKEINYLVIGGFLLSSVISIFLWMFGWRFNSSLISFSMRTIISLGFVFTATIIFAIIDRITKKIKGIAVRKKYYYKELSYPAVKNLIKEGWLPGEP